MIEVHPDTRPPEIELCPIRHSTEAPSLTLTVGRQTGALAFLDPKRPSPVGRQGVRDEHAILDIFELLAFFLTIQPMRTTPVTRKYRRLHHGVKPLKYSDVACDRCGRVIYVVDCLTEAPRFKITFLHGCPHLEEDWNFLYNVWQVRYFSLSCTSGWDKIEAAAPSPPECPAIHPFGQWLLHKDFVPVESRQWVESLSYTAPGLRYLALRRSKALDLADLINSLPGFTVVRTTADDHDARHLYCGKAIVSVSWIPPWAWTAYQIAQYLQLDSSFRGSCPFVYSVPQAVICNEALPLGWKLDVSEDLAIYDGWFEDLLFSERLLWDQLPSKPVLSDQGAALRAFCKKREFRQFLCRRHLIENFGAGGALGLLVARALRETSARSYAIHRGQYLADAHALRRAGVISERDLEKFCLFLSQDFEHGIWHRMDDGISSCTNHAERFHGVINQHLPSRAPLPERLAVIRDQMILKFNTFGTRRIQQFRELVNHLQQYQAPQTESCNDIDCAEFTAIMSRRFGLPSFPCKHTAHLDVWKGRIDPLHFPFVPPRPDRHIHIITTFGRNFPSKFMKRAAKLEEGDIPDDQPHLTLTWDDTEEFISDRNVEMTDADTSGSPAYREWHDQAVAHAITDGVIHFHKRAGRSTANERELFNHVWVHLKTLTRKAGPRPDLVQIAASCKAEWWAWAQIPGKLRPLPPHTWSPRIRDEEATE